MLEWQMYWRNPFGWAFDKTCVNENFYGPYDENYKLCYNTMIIGPLQMRWYS